MPFAELGIVPSEERNIGCVLNSRRHCTTLLTPSMGFAVTRPAEAVSQNGRIAVLHNEAAAGERHGCCE